MFNFRIDTQAIEDRRIERESFVVQRKSEQEANGRVYTEKRTLETHNRLSKLEDDEILKGMIGESWDE